MRVLTLATAKGGSGKSTLAAALAVAAAQSGETVVAIDIDPQRSLAKWGARRQTTDIVFRTAQPAGLQGLITDIRQHGTTSLAIVDTPGLFGAAVNQALQDATVVIVPSKPSILDIEASRPLATQLVALGKPFWFVLTQVTATSPGRAIDAAQALARMGALSAAMVGSRADFLDGMMSGLGPTELAPKGRAAEEITELWAWTKSKLDEAASGKT